MTFPTHGEIRAFDVEDNCLCIGGEKITDIATRLGSTPFYAYDRNAIRRRIAELRSVLPNEIKIHYAMKANPMPDVVSELGRLTDGLDVASAGELEIARQSGINASSISFAGPGKTTNELEIAIRLGSIINVESQTEIDRIATLANSTDCTPRIAIRVNPDFELKSSGMKMSGGPKPFGIDAESVPEILQDLSDLPIDFVGLHIFSGSQNLNAEHIQDSQSKTIELALKLSEFAPVPPKHINIGGGFGIPYFPGEKSLDLSGIAENLDVLLKKLKSKLPEADLILELGRFLIGEAGVYICKVLDKKESRKRKYLVTDGGLHHHLSASGNFGQVIRKNYPVLIANKITADRVENVSVVGPLCTPLDLLADRVDVSEAEIGDYVAIFQSGAYGFTASPQLFLSHPPPLEVLQ